jgi:hypothetical protein
VNKENRKNFRETVYELDSFLVFVLGVGSVIAALCATLYMVGHHTTRSKYHDLKLRYGTRVSLTEDSFYGTCQGKINGFFWIHMGYDTIRL